MIRLPTYLHGLKSQSSVKIDWEPAKIPEEKFNNVSCCHNYSKVNTLLSTPNKANIYKESRIKKTFTYKRESLNISSKKGPNATKLRSKYKDPHVYFFFLFRPSCNVCTTCALFNKAIKRIFQQGLEKTFAKHFF